MVRFVHCLGLLLCACSMANAQWIPTVLSTGSQFFVGARGISASGIAGYGFTLGSNGAHALYWANGGTSYVDLNPIDFLDSRAKECVGDYQYGYGHRVIGEEYHDHALQWHGSSGSAVDLHPNGIWTDSQIYGASENSQFGLGYVEGITEMHALLWHGSAEGVVDLTPTNAWTAIALGGDDNSQVGSVRKDFVTDHATLWHGSKETAIDLNPSWAALSFAFSASGEIQGGYAGFNDGDNGFVNHATLWRGSASSAVDINGSSFLESQVSDVVGNFQVGSAKQKLYLNQYHAIIWQGSAESAIDLQSTLSARYVSSIANGVTADGDVVGFGYDANNNADLIRWTHVVPEPASVLAVAIGIGFLLRRKKS